MATRYRNRHKAEAQRTAKLEAIEAMVRDGTLTIWQATREERAQWDAERTARERAYRPGDGELVVPGVSAREQADLDCQRERDEDDEEETGR